MLKFFSKNQVGFIAKYCIDANLFRLGSSIQKYVGTRGTAPVGGWGILVAFGSRVGVRDN